MFNTFNMGVGMIIVVSAASARTAIETLRNAGEDAYILGDIVPGERGVEIDEG
jgi:phosphoribosylformylglycinamidine cyclo-ligase